MNSNINLMLGAVLAAMLAAGGCGQGTTKEPPTLHLHLPADGTTVFGSRVIDRIELREQANLFVSENGNAVNPVLHLDKSAPLANFLNVRGALRSSRFIGMTIVREDATGEDHTFIFEGPWPNRLANVLVAGVSNRVYWVQSPSRQNLMELKVETARKIVDGSELREQINALKALDDSRLWLSVRNDDATVEGMLDLIDAAREGGFSNAVLFVEGQ
ncbi:MAG: hypothetical protein U1F77_19435 [Kiritimatiellia bacterium]